MRPYQRACLAMILALVNSTALLAQPDKEEIAKIEGAAPAKASMKPARPRKLLVFNRYEGFQHRAIQYASKTLEILGKKTGAFEVVQSTDMAVFAPEYLRQFDAVCFNNTTALKFEDPAYRKSLLDFIAGGKGIVGIHAATDNFNTWPEGVELFGGQFDGHPWTADGTWQVKIADPKHPLNAAFRGKDFLIRDEIYRIRQVNLRKNCRVLLELDARSERNRKASGVRPTDRDLPISWVRSYGKGRLFYCSLGHNDEIYWNPAILRHYLDGIQFALGDYPVDTTPVPFDPMGFFDRDSLSRILGRISTYHFGDSRAAMTELNDFVRGIEDIPEARLGIERQLLDFVRGNATADGKQFIFSRLSQMGSDAAVPELSGLLSDPATAGLALYALEAIPGPKADGVLLEALKYTRGKALVGVINALGNRRVEAAVPLLGEMLGEKDSTLSLAVAASLARIGNGAAMERLMDAKSSGAPRGQVQQYALLCADRVKSAGDTAAAIAVYRELSSGGETLPVRRGALRGLILSEPRAAAATITQALKSPQVGLQSAVIQIVGELPDLEAVRTIARSYPDLPVSGQAQLLAALASRPDAVVQETVLSALGSRVPEVRLAALRALRTCGDASVVRPLVAKAATAKGLEQAEARRSLDGLQAHAADDSLLSLLEHSGGSIRVELIRSAGARGIISAAPMLIKGVTDPSTQVRLESARSLKALAPADALPELARLLTGSQGEAVRRELEQAVVNAAATIHDSSQRDEVLLSVYPSAQSPEAKLSFIRVLGKIGDPSSLPLLRQALTEKSPEIRLATIRALAEWPTAEPYRDLWAVVTAPGDKTEKAVALRGAVRLLGLDTGRPPEEALECYRQALAAAPSVEEKKRLVASTGQAKSVAALRFVAGCLTQESLREEAQASILQIAPELTSLPSREVVPSLEELIKLSPDDASRGKARDVIHQLERYDDYITDWQYAGPYAKEGAKLLDESFAPEEPSAPVEWKTFPPVSNPDAKWLLDFEKVIGGIYKVVYVRTNVFSPEGCSARLEAGSDDGIKVWLNGRLVHAITISRSARPGTDLIPVTLKQGWNTLLMKINQTDGGWGACARFRRPDGRALEGIRISAAPVQGAQ